MPPKQPSQPCRFMSTPQGCRFGNSCKFSHSRSGRSTPTQQAGPSSEPGTTQPCRFLSTPQGCRFGRSCKFSHNAGRGRSTPAHQAAASSSGSDRGAHNAEAARHQKAPKAPGGMCNDYYAKGTCRLGFECKFKHTAGPNVSQSPGGASSSTYVASTASGSATVTLAYVQQGLRKFLSDDLYRFPNVKPVYSFTRLLGAASTSVHSWSMEDGQMLLAYVNNDNGSLRINDILAWSPVSFKAGLNRHTLSFQLGLLPLIRFLSCDILVKSTLSHLVNKLYGLLLQNIDNFVSHFTASMKEALAAHTFQDPTAGTADMPAGHEIFRHILVVLFELLTRFKNVAQTHSCLTTFARELNSWLEDWIIDVNASSFGDPLTSSLAPQERLHVTQPLLALSVRIVAIVDRDDATLQRTLRRPVTLGVSRANEGLLAMLSMNYQGPGSARALGQRHDNDFIHIEEIRIAPTHDELTCLTPPFLPANFYDAPHEFDPESMERLLDIQFRLLREELTAPLRSSTQLVSADLKSPPHKGNQLNQLLAKKGGKYHGCQDTRESVMFNVYTNVHFHSMFPDRRGISISLTLDAPPGKAQSDASRVRAAFWEGAGGKRLMQGGLVGLVWKRGTTVDVYLGTVVTAQKDIVDCARREKGRIQLRVVFFDSEATLRIMDDIRSSHRSHNHTKILVEAPIMYEAIRPFLEALKVVPEAVPFERYLPHMPPQTLSTIPILPPKMATKPGFKYQLASLFPSEAGVTSLQLDVQDSLSIAIARQELVLRSRLDESQAHAVVDTLTRELSLIQGPPGTGKSYTGVELIRVLIENKCGPILLIAFTNHALDHLLAAVLDIGIKKIVRMGSRSSDERILELSIENLERTAEAQAGLKKTSGRLYRDLKLIEEEIEKLVKKIHRKTPTSQELLDHLRDKYPEHRRNFNFPSAWILDLYAQWKAGDDWQTAGRSGKAKAPRDTTLYSFWISGHDITYIDFARRSASQPPAQHTKSTPSKSRTENLAGRSSNRFVLPESTATATFPEDQSEDEEGDEPWQQIRWSLAGNVRSIAPVLPSPTSPPPPPPSPPPVPFAQVMDPNQFESERSFTDSFFNRYGLHFPTIPSSNRDLDELVQSSDIWSMSKVERNRLNTHWVAFVSAESYELHQAEFINLQQKHATARQRHEEGRNELWRNILTNAHVIGCTTNGAAKLTTLLKGVSPRVMLVEEAGQVLEAHVLGSLVPSVEHLILIGDPLQLRPTLNNYSLSMDSRLGRDLYRLDMSLMERLSTGGLPMSVINTQRRMRPCISSLIRNTLYKDLEDSNIVKQYPSVRGFAKDLYFLSHNHRESGGGEESSSKYNMHEVQMIKDMVLYLLRQGCYLGDGDIVVLCAYLGQLGRVRDALSDQVTVVLDERDATALEDQEGLSKAEELTSTIERVQASRKVKIRTIDNFQGEEGKIVILSLVRNAGSLEDPERVLSKLSNAIGFLKSENRSNVALSRAREGMFILGNADQMSGRSSMWKKVIEELCESDSCGRGLPVACHQHPESVNYISEPGQLPSFAPDGGCQRLCEARLACGHLCPYNCHPDDKNHVSVSCTKLCTRLCIRQHPCSKLCAKDCGKCSSAVSNVLLPCGHTASSVPCHMLDDLDNVFCLELVSKQLRGCEHTATMACSLDPSRYACESPCDQTMPCCGRQCTAKCQQCQHLSMPPSATPAQVTPAQVTVTPRVSHSPHPCRALLYCSHQCSNTCSVDHQHSAKCPRSCRQECVHATCRFECSKPCAPCQEVCSWNCSHHTCSVPCGSVCARLPCDLRCDKQLSCGHRCPSVCGENCSIQVCPTCCKDKKNDVVDLLMSTTLGNIDPNSEALESIIITLPKCKHTFTVETLDGHCDMSSVYEREVINGEPGRYLALKAPPSDFQKPPTCPTCRAAITSPRYGRVFKRADLDILERNVASSMSSSISQISKTISSWNIPTLEKRMEEAAAKLPKELANDLGVKGQKCTAARNQILNEQRHAPISPRSLDPANSSLHRIPTAICLHWKNITAPISGNYQTAFELGQTRSAHTKAWESAFSYIFRQETDRAVVQPSDLPADVIALAQSVARQRIGQPEPLADKRYVVEAIWASLENRFIQAQLGGALLKALGKQVENPDHVKQWAAFVLFILESCVGDADRACRIAASSKARKQMSKASVQLSRAYLERFRFSVEVAQQSGILKNSEVRAGYVTRTRSGMAEVAATFRAVMQDHLARIQTDSEVKWLAENVKSPMKALTDEWASLERSLQMETVYEPVSLQEKISIVKALNFSHTGHFYNCPNGHPFVIGECGGAMQTARCPECDEPVGGDSHNLLGTSSRANDLEQIATAEGSQRSPWAWAQ